MSTPIGLHQLNAFVDGELDLGAQLEMEARLREDPALRMQAQRLRELRQAVRDRAAYHAAPAGLHQRMQAMVAPSAAAAPARPSRHWFAWPAWAGAAAATAAALLIGLNTVVLPVREQQRIAEDVVASHVRATLGQRSVDVASSDLHTVKPWLSSRLDFSPPVPRPGDAGTALLGGRVDYVDGRPVAALAWRRGAHEADEFVWPQAGPDQGLAMSSARGFHIARWTRDGMVHWLISDLNRDELAQVARQLGAPA